MEPDEAKRTRTFVRGVIATVAVAVALWWVVTA
jgi:hypothetical protein